MMNWQWPNSRRHEGDTVSIYLHIARALFTQTWAIRREEWDVLAGILSERITHGPLSSAEVDERISAARDRRAVRPGGTCRRGRHPDARHDHSQGEPARRVIGCHVCRGDARAAGPGARGSDVGALVLDIDSPGGIVSLVPEFARELRAARAQKPIVAVANPFAASAAFWLGAQADEFMVTPSGEVGSVGVFNFHQDWSAFGRRKASRRRSGRPASSRSRATSSSRCRTMRGPTCKRASITSWRCS